MRPNLSSTKVHASPRKWVAKRNTSSTQVQNLRRLASPFGQGLKLQRTFEFSQVKTRRRFLGSNRETSSTQNVLRTLQDGRAHEIQSQSNGSFLYPKLKNGKIILGFFSMHFQSWIKKNYITNILKDSRAQIYLQRRDKHM